MRWSGNRTSAWTTCSRSGEGRLRAHNEPMSKIDPGEIRRLAEPWRDPQDEDPEETREWADALAAVVRRCGRERGLFLLKRLEEQAQELGVVAHVPPHSAYQNTIPLGQQGPYPGDLALEQRITSIVRWNALAMVMRANQASGELGGHVASYASAAEIFEVGFNHFFRAPHDGHAGDLVFFQPHS